MRRVPALLLLSWLVFCATCVRAEPPQDSKNWQRMHVLGYVVTSSVLVHFNDFEDAQDLNRPVVYQQDLAHMQRLAQALQSVKAQRLIAAMDALIHELESLPRKSVNRYGHGLEQLLELQAQLNAMASLAVQVSVSDVPSVEAQLSELSLAIGRLLQIYEVRTFKEVPRHAIDVSVGRVLRLDEQIRKMFDAIDGRAPQLSRQLAVPKRQYFFVRDKLLDSHQIWTPSGVDLFLGRSIRSLIALAAGETDVSPGSAGKTP